MKKFFSFCGIMVLINQVGKLLERLIVKIKEVFVKDKKTETKKAESKAK